MRTWAKGKNLWLRSLMEDHKILKAHVDDSIKEVKDSFSKELTEIRNIGFHQSSDGDTPS
ncbi:hypothetical protein KY290_010969 [Solanum tuberosum]|uniref:Uncharacterized protein n=1 Tax=Solanum tuberosum TaxID=4113 RepID=A0ABQ7VZA1_SOLTU|nr:hypothetical protein KY290_010969 [Solanum tuberosum]